MTREVLRWPPGLVVGALAPFMGLVFPYSAWMCLTPKRRVPEAGGAGTACGALPDAG
jgi:hypothetical protein